MGQRIELQTPHGTIGGWRADPDGRPRGGIVVIQEIFGANAHIRSVVERFADYGYAVVAPALFDVVEPDVELGYDAEGFARGKQLVQQLGSDRALECVDAARKSLSGVGKIGAVGYCWGGSIAFLANTRLALPAVSYYGARTVQFLGEESKAPMLFHFGARDASIPPADIEKHRVAQPQAEFHVWPADHGFNRDVGNNFDADSASKALAITLGFFERELT